MLYLIGLLVLMMCYCLYILFRNQLVCKYRLKCVEIGTYQELPPYDYMLYRFWEWSDLRLMRGPQ